MIIYNAIAVCYCLMSAQQLRRRKVKHENVFKILYKKHIFANTFRTKEYSGILYSPSLNINMNPMCVVIEPFGLPLSLLMGFSWIKPLFVCWMRSFFISASWYLWILCVCLCVKHLFRFDLIFGYHNHFLVVVVVFFFFFALLCYFIGTWAFWNNRMMLVYWGGKWALLLQIEWIG